MIFGARTAYAGLGAASTKDNVARVQRAMKMLAARFNEPRYNPQRTDGKVNFETAFGLMRMAKDGIAEIPYVSKFVNAFWTILGLGPLTTQQNLHIAWASGSVIEGVGDFRADMIHNIEKFANKIGPALENLIPKPPPIWTSLPAAQLPGTFVDPTQPQPVNPSALPVGTVAVLDDESNVYLLVAPPEA